MAEKVDVVKKLAMKLVSEECYEKYFLEFDFLDGKSSKVTSIRAHLIQFLLFQATVFVPC